MKTENQKTPYRVVFTEHERGWGSRVDEILFFETAEQAQKCAEEYNAKYNTADSAPDWYIVAEYMSP